MGTDFKQGANEDPTLGNIHWITSILQQNNSTYYEGMAVPQRLILTDLPDSTNDTYHLLFHVQNTKSGTHAYDFLTSWEQAVATAAAAGITTTLNECGEAIGPPATLSQTCVALHTSGYSLTIPLPDDPFISKDGSTQQRIDAFEAVYGDRTLTIYGDQPILSASITLVHVPSASGSDTGDSDVYYNLTWVSASSSIIVEYAGHLAVSGIDSSGINWGPGLGSSQISGGPYHFSLDGLQTLNSDLTLNTVSLGAQDNQIKGADILSSPPTCAITGQGATCENATNLTFSASSNGSSPTYSWSISGNGTINGSSTGSSVSVNAGTSGTFTLTVTITSDGRVVTCSKTVNVTAPPVVQTTGGTLTCTQSTVTLNATSSIANSTFAWTTDTGNIVSGANTATPVVSAAGTYTVTVTSPDGCSVTSSALVAGNTSAPNANAGGDFVLTCTTTQVTLTGSSSTANAQFSWVASNGGHIVSGANTATPIVDTAGTYTFTVTDPANGCTTSDSASVTADTTPPDLTPGQAPTLNCTTSQATLSVLTSVQNATFSWVASNGGNIVSGANSANPVIDHAGTYTVTVTNPANGCTATASIVVTGDATPPNVSAGTAQALTCTTTQLTLQGSSSTANATFAWVATNGGHIVSGANTATPLVDAAGTYTLTVTNPANGCTATASVQVTADNNPPDVTPGAPPVLNCTTSSATLSVTTSVQNATFSWVASNGGNIVSGANTATPLISSGGTYTVTVTNPANGCTATATVTVAPADTTPPTCNITTPATAPSCGSAGNTLTVTSDGVSFSWQVTSGTAQITAGADSSTITFTAGTGPSTFSVTVTGANGCTSTCTAIVGCTAENGEFCTVTQGFWGSAAGRNGKFDGVSGSNLLQCLMANALTIGVPGVRSLTFADAACVIAKLPAGGNPDALPAFEDGANGPDRTISGPDCNTSDPSLPLKKDGRIANVFVGQVVTLSLNLRLNPELGNFELPETLTTVKALPGTNGTVGEPLECINDSDTNDDVPNLDPLTCTSRTRTFPSGLVGMTVNELLSLANAALAGQDTGFSFAQLNDAISAINEAFDGCRFIGMCPATFGAQPIEQQSIEKLLEDGE